MSFHNVKRSSNSVEVRKYIDIDLKDVLDEVYIYDVLEHLSANDEISFIKILKEFIADKYDGGIEQFCEDLLK